jgi:hypothetical protein
VRILFAIIFLCFILVGCNKPPTACIEIDQTTVTPGTTVTLTSCSKKALSYEWFMSGPAGAPENTKGWSDEVITNAFTVPGTYTVSLTAYKRYSFLGESSTAEATITVQ